VKTLRLGLIGGNITESRSPALQIVCGLSVGLNVSYDLLIPDEQGLSLKDMLQRCRDAGFDGVNVTYPYKEDVLKYVDVGEPIISELGAANTVRFSTSGATAWNTDYSGFIAAYRAKWGDAKPGRVLMIGTGGVGRAIAFALVSLGASEVVLHDIDTAKAKALAATVGAKVVGAKALVELEGIDGVINCTPLGMAGREGSALPAAVTGKPRWAFDAVYTPEHTLFRAQTEKLGAEFLSGYELYFNQGIQGFKIFSGRDVTDLEWVRRILAGRN
jgi:shikimate dehydrogenase